MGAYCKVKKKRKFPLWYMPVSITISYGQTCDQDFTFTPTLSFTFNSVSISKNHLYRWWESNPHGHYCPRDFKSLVSTYSTTSMCLVIQIYEIKFIPPNTFYQLLSYWPFAFTSKPPYLVHSGFGTPT